MWSPYFRKSLRHNTHRLLPEPHTKDYNKAYPPYLGRYSVGSILQIHCTFTKNKHNLMEEPL